MGIYSQLKKLEFALQSSRLAQKTLIISQLHILDYYVKIMNLLHQLVSTNTV